MHGAKAKEPSTISDKYSLDYYRRPLPTRSWKSPWNWTFLMIALGSVAGLYFARGDQSFHAAPVSAAHSGFGANCSACHDESWQTARRLVALSDAHHSVSDAACQSCHHAAEHVPGLLAESACVSCHQEHRPEQSLTQLADNTCTRCHGDLHDHLAAASFFPTITQFAEDAGGHPEFALLRTGSDDVGPRHKARQVAAHVADVAGQGSGGWKDRGGLKFNHRAHLDPAGVMDPDGKRTKLDCANCHVPEADGAYMQEVAYEQHCARCHLLRLAGDLARLGEIPHAGVEQVRGVIRERLAKKIQLAEIGQAVDGAHLLPLLPTPAQLTAGQEQVLDAQMVAADHAVFGLEAKGMCRHCHYVDEQNGSWVVRTVNPDVAKSAAATADSSSSMVPRRWLMHGSFHHKAHRAIECEKCHDAVHSSKTTTILLPSIAVCRSCHGADVSSASTPVRDDCVLCHTYHDEGQPFHGVALERLFFEASPESVAAPTP